MFNRTAEVDSSGVISITPNQIYIIPTKFGLVFAVMVIAILIGSSNYEINLGFVLTFLLTGIGLSAMFQSWKNLVRIELVPNHVSPVFVGEDVKFPVQVYNKKQTSRSGLQFQVDTHSYAIDLPPNQTQEVICQVSSTERGYFRPHRWKIFSYFPTGLFYCWAYFDSSQECLVYPKPITSNVSLDDFFKKTLTDSFANPEHTDFQGHREYQTGDNLKRLDWKALARGRGKLIKQFENHDEADLWLKWDEVIADDTEMKLSILCRAILILAETPISYGLEIPGTTIDPQSGVTHKHQCLTAIALLGK
jgi:uncharacterized protein (DUF58 family)